MSAVPAEALGVLEMSTEQKTADIVFLPGVERRDIDEVGNIDPADVLQGAVENGVTDVIVVGRRRDGSRYVASALPDTDRVLGILVDAVFYVQRCMGR